MNQAGTMNATEKPTTNRGFMMAVGMMVSLVMGTIYAFSIFVIPLESTFGWARHQTAMTFSLVMTFFGLGMFTSGDVMARVGPGKTVSSGGLIAAAGFFLASFSPNVYVLYLGYGILGGYGIGLTTMVTIVTMVSWFPDRKGLAAGLPLMSMAFGTFFLGTKLSGGLVDAYGWAITFRVLAGVFLLVVVSGGLLLKSPPPAYTPANWTPPDGQEEIWGYSRAGILKTGVCWMVCLWIVCIHLGGLMVFGHVVPFFVEQGVSPANAALAMGAFAIANGVGRLFFGWFHDNFSLKTAMITNGLFMVAGLIGVVFLFDIFGFIGVLVTICLVAMGYGGSIPLLVMTSNTFFGPKFFPKNYGFFALTGAMVGGLIGPALGGYLQAITGSYTVAFLSAAAVATLGVLIAATLKPPPKRTDNPMT